MPKPGLPKKYAKMGFKKGWKAYKASKRKPARKTARKATSRAVAKRSTPTKTARKRGGGTAVVSKRKRPRTARGFVDASTRAMMNVGIGVSGAVTTAGVVNALPIQSTQGKAWTQTLLGVATAVLSPRKMRWLRVAGAGAAMHGGISVVKSMGFILPLLAGVDENYIMPRRISPPGMNGVPRRYMGANRAMGATANRLVRDPGYTPYQKGMQSLGVNKSGAMMGYNFGVPQGSALGGRYLNSAFDM